jgi:hypothetical protein
MKEDFKKIIFQTLTPGPSPRGRGERNHELLVFAKIYHPLALWERVVRSTG